MSQSPEAVSGTTVSVDVIVDDLAFVVADAVARSVDAELRAVTPVLRRMEEAAGASLLRQLRVNEPLEVGAAVVTGAGALSTELMIHAVVATRTESVSADGVRRATLSTLQRAHDFGVVHLAMAPFGLGAGNLDEDACARVMLDAVHEHCSGRARPERITMVAETEREAESFRAVVVRRWGAA
ncbi:MAG: macro domain-containing protein [Gemmatimonadaceae bacterium]